MAPTPKPPGQRRRRNAEAPAWRKLGSRSGKTPALPPRKPTWLKATRDWWRAIWSSPMATAWLPSDVPTLVRLARIVEADNRGSASASLLAEARQLEDRFGLSPMARRRLQWEVSRGGESSDGADDGGGQAQRPVRALPDVRRLRAVEPS